MIACVVLSYCLLDWLLHESIRICERKLLWKWRKNQLNYLMEGIIASKKLLKAAPLVLGNENDDAKPRLQSSLPPEVQGQAQCYLAVRIDQIKWKVEKHPKNVQVCLRWWGEKGNGTMFWYKFTLLSLFLVYKNTTQLLDNMLFDYVTCYQINYRPSPRKTSSNKTTSNSTALFPVCCGPNQFSAYLQGDYAQKDKMSLLSKKIQIVHFIFIVLQSFNVFCWCKHMKYIIFEL